MNAVVSERRPAPSSDETHGSTTAFAVSKLRVAFGSDSNSPVVDGVDFSVEAGKTLAIIGESGSGKSVSLLAATGLLPARQVTVSGRATVGQTDLLASSRRELRSVRGREIGFVFQDPQSNLHPLKTIGAAISEALTAHGRLPRKQVRARVLELLAEVGIREPQQRIDDYPVQFSGGMRQRVNIAAALALHPRVLIADEPTTALDVTVQAGILKLLKRLQDEHGTAIVFVTHDLAVVSDIADTVTVMRSGKVVETAPAEQIYRTPAHPYTQQLLSASRHRLPAGSTRAGSVSGTSPLLTLEKVSKQYSQRRSIAGTAALTDISVDLRPGEILGLVGESGSGKSTIGRIVAGLIRPTSGTAAHDGAVYNIAGDGLPKLTPATRTAIQMVFQDPYASLNPRRTVASTLSEPLQLHGSPGSGELRESLEKLLTQVGLSWDLLPRYPAQLSGGQRQRVAIARAIALEPAVLVADEPVSSLDITTAQQIITLLRSLRDELGLAILFVSHDLGVVAALCDRVAVLSAGEVVETGSTAEVFDNPAHPYTRGLIESIPGRRLLTENPDKAHHV
ncbi:MAG: ABC transporter ATP-binding protein [Gordonia sp.]|nr:ABC transporter ATP-binding protein [Gordonia sp. (in: high G+C Gram-positive bacteria)]